MADFAVITTLNEEATIDALVGGLREQGLQVVVVDDCSSDDTARVALRAGAAAVVNTQTRMGIGPALMLGWQEALWQQARRVVQIDAGGSHHAADARRLLACQAETGADVVVGSRFCRGAVYERCAAPRWRPLASRAAAAAASAATGTWYSDWTSGLRVFTADALRQLLAHYYTAKMHGWQIEVLARANAAGLTIVETPITYTAGRSSFNWRVAHEASNSLLHVFFHVGGRSKHGTQWREGCTGNKRLSQQQPHDTVSLSETTVTEEEQR